MIDKHRHRIRRLHEESSKMLEAEIKRHFDTVRQGYIPRGYTVALVIRLLGKRETERLEMNKFAPPSDVVVIRAANRVLYIQRLDRSSKDTWRLRNSRSATVAHVPQWSSGRTAHSVEYTRALLASLVKKLSNLSPRSLSPRIPGLCSLAGIGGDAMYELRRIEIILSDDEDDLPTHEPIYRDAREAYNSIETESTDNNSGEYVPNIPAGWD